MSEETTKQNTEPMKLEDLFIEFGEQLSEAIHDVADAIRELAAAIEGDDKN